MAIGKITSKSLDSNAVTSTNLAPGAVTISDIPDGEITADKLHTTLDLSTKTLTLTQASVTAHESALSVTQSQISDLSTTSDLAEGTNLYFTNARADARITASDTDALSEGSTNLYYTDARADARAALLVDSAPGTLDTLNELAAALGDDPNFATTVTNSIATKLPLAGGTMTGDVLYNDNVKAKFGAGSDLQIYHDGSHSFINDTGTGDLYIRGSNNIRLQSNSGETYLIGELNGAVYLRHNDVNKLATTATGIDVTGTVTADGIFVDTDSIYSVSGTNRVGINKTSPATTLDVGGSIFFSSILRSTSGGSEASPSIQPGLDGDTGMFWPAVNTIGLTTGGTERMRIDSSGNVGIGAPNTSVFNGVGGSSKLVVKGADSSTNILNNSDASITIANDDGTANNLAGLHFARADTDDNPHYAGASIVAQFVETQVTGQYPKGELAFLTSTASNTAPSEKVRIDSSGNVGIGTSSPYIKLHTQINTATEWTGTANLSNTTNKPIFALLLDNSDSSITDTEVNMLFSAGASGSGQHSIGVKRTGTNTGDMIFRRRTGGGSSAETMRIDSSGNVGIGNTSNLSTSLGTLLNVNNATIIGNNTGGAYFGYNARYDGTWKRNETSAVGLLSFTNSGGLTFRQAVSGNAGTEPSLTEVFSVSAGGQINAKLSATTAAMVTATQTAASAAAVISSNNANILWAIKTASNSSWYSISGDRFTILKSGLVSLNVNQDIITTGASSYVQCRISVNGSIKAYQLITNTDGQWNAIVNHWCGYLNVNDYITLAFQGPITNIDHGSWSNYDFTWIAQ